MKYNKYYYEQNTRVIIFVVILTQRATCFVFWFPEKWVNQLPLDCVVFYLLRVDPFAGWPTATGQVRTQL